MDHSSLECRKRFQNGFLASLSDLLGDLRCQVSQCFSSLLSVVVTVEGYSDSVGQLLLGNEVNQVLEGVQNFTVLSDQEASFFSVDRKVNVLALEFANDDLGFKS